MKRLWWRWVVLIGIMYGGFVVLWHETAIFGSTWPHAMWVALTLMGGAFAITTLVLIAGLWANGMLGAYAKSLKSKKDPR